MCCIGIFVDVVQAFPSVVVALTLPLPDRDDSTEKILEQPGFASSEAEQILIDNEQCVELENASEHLQALVANVQEDQWLSSDFAGGIMASAAGCSAGCHSR